MVVGAFAMGADEFIVAGVVREIATALDVTIGAVGHLESVYALGVAIGAPLFTFLGVRVGRRSMLFTTAGVFLLGNLVSALAPTYSWIMAGRVISAMAHGAFLGIAAVFAAELVDPARKGRAVALVFSGLTASTVLGAPIGAAVGQALGWRFTFWTLVVLGGVALLALLATLPRTAQPMPEDHDEHGAAQHIPHEQAPTGEFEGLDAHALAHLGGAGHGPTMAEQARALARPAVWAALLSTLLGYGGVFTSYVYVAPQITDVAGLDERWITPLLLLFGAGLFVGNHLGGKFADRNLQAAIVVTLAALATTMFAMSVAIRFPVSAVLMMFVFGVAAFAVVAPLQLRVMNAAGHAPDVASAANISAFTLGSAIGIYLGGAAIDGGLGLASVNWIGGLITLAGLLVATATLRRTTRVAPGEHVEPVHHEHGHQHAA
jgi:predicted MFS family arabinose efflux permease